MERHRVIMLPGVLSMKMVVHHILIDSSCIKRASIAEDCYKNTISNHLLEPLDQYLPFIQAFAGRSRWARVSTYTSSPTFSREHEKVNQQSKPKKFHIIDVMSKRRGWSGWACLRSRLAAG